MYVLDDKAKEEAQIQFRTPIPLKRLAMVIDIIRDMSRLYELRKVGSLPFLDRVFSFTCNFKENNWFFASIIQEISVQFLGGSFKTGQLNHPTLACDRRKTIKARVHAMLQTSLTALVKDLEYFTLMTNDKSIHGDVMRLVRIVETQGVCQPHFPTVVRYSNRFPQRLVCCSDLDDTRLWKGLGAYLVQLLEDCRSVVYEHLHGLSEFPGARKLRSSFSA